MTALIIVGVAVGASAVAWALAGLFGYFSRPDLGEFYREAGERMIPSTDLIQALKLKGQK